MVVMLLAVIFVMVRIVIASGGFGSSGDDMWDDGNQCRESGVDDYCVL